jgi:hypothetical protein
VFRAVPRRIVAGLFVVCTPAIAGAQQQGSVQLSSDTQIVSGNGLRQAGEETIEPDAAVLWTEPGTSFGAFQLETHLTRRGDELHVGRTWLTFHDVKAAGLTWSFEGGDLYNRSDPTDYQFSNLTSTTLTFTGGFVTARSGRTTIQAGGGRSNALLNIFGTDAQALGQTLGLVRATVRPDDRWTLNARAVRTRTSDLGGFTRTVDASDQAGGGARFIVTPSCQLVADASYVRYRATGSAVETQDYSYVAGSHLLLGRGSVELNATRFSPGDMPVLSATMQDRSGIFASMDYDVSKRAHVFAGWESADTNINPSGTALLRPEATSNRGFGGIRLRVPGRSTIAVRLERGGRIAQPVAGYPVINGVLATQSDTGSYSAEWQTSVDRLTAFTRFSIRNNIDVTSGTGTFTQRETSGQVFYDVSRRRHDRQRDYAGRRTQLHRCIRRRAAAASSARVVDAAGSDGVAESRSDLATALAEKRTQCRTQRTADALHIDRHQRLRRSGARRCGRPERMADTIDDSCCTHHSNRGGPTGEFARHG